MVFASYESFGSCPSFSLDWWCLDPDGNGTKLKVSRQTQTCFHVEQRSPPSRQCSLLCGEHHVLSSRKLRKEKCIFWHLFFLFLILYTMADSSVFQYLRIVNIFQHLEKCTVDVCCTEGKCTFPFSIFPRTRNGLRHSQVWKM